MTDSSAGRDEILREPMVQAANKPSVLRDRAGEEKPFQEIFAPYIIKARRQLQEAVSNLSVLAPEACRGLEQALLSRLSGISIFVLDHEFTEWRPAGTTFLAALLKDDAGSEPPSREQYLAFVDSILKDEMRGLFQKYPVLEGLLETAVEFWVQANAELLHRLEADFPSSRVSAIQTNMSDFHNCGRSVSALTFEDGRRLVYKPKNLGSELEFNNLLKWINERGISLKFKAVEVLARQDYGWVEFIDQRPCEDKEAAGRFYTRAGMLLAVLHALRATDCHRENLIAHGEYPVFVDAETLLAQDLESASWVLMNSVLRVGLLPRWSCHEGDSASCDVTALGSTEPQTAPRKQPSVKFMNTDSMMLVSERSTIPPAPNVAMLDGAPLSPNEYQSEFLAGFQEIYRFLIRHRSELLSASGPIAPFRKHPVRLLYRPTVTYYRFIMNSFEAPLLRDQARRSAAFKILHRQEEVDALERMDVPHFTVQGETGYERVRERIEGMSEDDSKLQRRLIEQSFRYRLVKLHRDAADPADPAVVSGMQPLSHGELLTEAAEIARELTEHAFRSPDGSLHWISPSPTRTADRLALNSIPEDLYSGRAGVALFYSALHRATGENQYRDFALAALARLRNLCTRESGDSLSRFLSRIGFGGLTGAGSIIYTLSKVGLLDEAMVVARSINKDAVLKDRRLDIVSGAPGMILGLLALYAETGDGLLLEMAAIGGNHLCERRRGEDGWTHTQAPPLTGFSHGAAGVAYALQRLFAHVKDARFVETANAALEYERSAYSTEARNWPDFRFSKDGTRFMTTWCHGAPGIGLARAGIPNCDEEAVENALKTTEAQGMTDIDHVCCGNLGTCDVLLTASEKLSRPALREAAQKRTAWVVGRKRRTRSYRLFNGLPEQPFVPGFFQGLSGIGYELLRLRDPRQFPSVLLLD